MDQRRPDYAAYVTALGLPPDASPVDVLGRASGQRKGDTAQVISEPVIAPNGDVDDTFLPSGGRHAPGDPLAATDALEVGAAVNIRPQPENQVHPRAHLVCTAGGSVLGWVPDALLDLVQEVIRADYQVTAARLVRA